MKYTSNSSPMECQQSSPRRKLGQGPQSRPPNPEYDRSHPPNGNTDKGQNTRSPAVPQLLIQVRRKQGETKARQAPENRARGHGTRGVRLVTVHNVHLHPLQAANHADAAEQRANIRHDPMRAADAPSVPEQPDGQDDRANGQAGHAELGPSDAAVPALEGAVHAVHHLQLQEDADKAPDGNGEVVEAPHPLGLAVHLGPDVGERGKHEVQRAKEVGHVDGDASDDGLRGKHADGALHRAQQRAAQRLLLLARVQVPVARLAGEAVPSPAEDRRRVRLAQPHEAEGLDDGRGDAGGIKDPSPRRVLRDEGAGDGADDGPQHRAHGVCAHGLAALLGLPHVAVFFLPRRQPS